MYRDIFLMKCSRCNDRRFFFTELGLKEYRNNDPKFRTDRYGQTVQTQIRLLLEELSDQGLHFLLFCLHLMDPLLNGKATLFKF